MAKKPINTVVPGLEENPETPVIPVLDNIENAAETAAMVAGMAQVPQEQLNELLNQLQEYKNDIVALVSVFHGFAGLFNGKTNALSLTSTIIKMITDPATAQRVQHIFPIIEKYTQSGQSQSV